MTMKSLLTIFLALQIGIMAFLGIGVTQIQASTDLTLTCANQGPCTLNTNQPLFDETNIAPGATFTQSVTVINQDSDDACNLSIQLHDKGVAGRVNLADKMFAAITDSVTLLQGQLNGQTATDHTTYAELYALPAFSAGTIPANSTRTYAWYATFDPTTGNEYQNQRTSFDFDLTAECNSVPPTSPSPSSTPSTSSSGGTGSTAGTSDAKPYVCSATAPTQAPVITSITTGVNTATLTWTAVPNITHYAVFFNHNNDGAAYSALNIGNVTSYTINNLSGGGATYTFEVMGVNDCAPGPRSAQSRSGQVGGLAFADRPIGQGGEILGAQDIEEVLVATESGSVAGDSTSGIVAGIATEACKTDRWYLPYLLLVIQAILVLVVLFRVTDAKRRMLFILGITALSCIVFYILRQCDCDTIPTLLAFLCQWYWVVSAGESLLLGGGFKLLEKQRKSGHLS